MASVSSQRSTQSFLSETVSKEVKEIVERETPQTGDVEKIRDIFSKHHVDSPLWEDSWTDVFDTALSLATEHRRFDIAETLVKDLDADPNIGTPMIHILRRGPVRILKLFMHKGGKVYDVGRKGEYENCLHSLFNDYFPFCPRPLENTQWKQYHIEQQEKVALVASALGEKKIQELANQLDQNGYFPLSGMCLRAVDFNLSRLEWILARTNKENINTFGGSLSRSSPLQTALQSRSSAASIQSLLVAGADPKKDF